MRLPARSGAEGGGGVTSHAPDEQYLDLADGRVRLLRAGQGEPLLFLHAAGGGAWLDYHQLLAGGFDVIAPDHPGFGGSDDFPDVEAIDDLVFHYLDVMDALGLDRPHVVGASFGGWIAAELAVTAPHRIGSLILLSPAGLRLPGHPVADIFLMPPGQLVAALFQHPPPAAAALTPDIDAILAAYRDQTAVARFSWSPYLCNPKLERRLHRIKAPTLVVAPTADRLIPVAHARRYAERIPAASLTEIDDCGHAMYVERPAEFADLTLTFLGEHRLSEHPLNGVSR
jgi:pimeloyl-ACP methyl ester carboxylesterase